MRGTITRQRIEFPVDQTPWQRLLKRALDLLQLETQTEISWINHRSMTAEISAALRFRVLSPTMVLDSGSSTRTIVLSSHMDAPPNFHGPLFLKNGNSGDITITASNGDVVLSANGSATEGDVAMFVQIGGYWHHVNK